jgi:hypothetical protein
MPPKKKDAKGAADDEEPSEENKDLLEKELVISYLKMKLAACDFTLETSLVRVDLDACSQ